MRLPPWSECPGTSLPLFYQFQVIHLVGPLHSIPSGACGFRQHHLPGVVRYLQAVRSQQSWPAGWAGALVPVVSPDEEWDVLSSCELSLLYFSADGIMFLCVSKLYGVYQVQLVHLSSASRPDIPLLCLTLPPGFNHNSSRGGSIVSWVSVITSWIWEPWTPLLCWWRCIWSRKASVMLRPRPLYFAQTYYSLSTGRCDSCTLSYASLHTFQPWEAKCM